MRDEVIRLLARDWMARDPDPTTRLQTETMLQQDDLEALRDHFGKRLQFGTAGLRGALGPGPNRMNRVLVRTVTTGLADYLLATVRGAPDKGVVIGFDARRNSKVFAQDAAVVLATRGFKVWLTDGVVPTPFVSFAMTDLGAAASIVVTASHNPPEDNGYKVFWGDGAQIVPPHDTGISAAIDAVESVGKVPSLDEVADLVQSVPAGVRSAYLEAIAAQRVQTGAPARIVYSAMHGVGASFIEETLGAAGHTVISVPQQRDPDGAFPTVRFPNPEEPGALDLAKALGAAEEAHAVFANDPDADRLAVALPREDGTWQQLTGNQVGLLLADDLLQRGFAGDADRLVATTIVSSAMLEPMAKAHGVRYVETLTGFKWIGQAAIAHAARGGRFVVGFEEALGYSVGDVVRDKDGVSAALYMADLVGAEAAQGRTLWDRLDDLYRRYGAYVSGQVARKLVGDAGAARIQEILAQLRADPPTAIAGRAVLRQRDVQTGIETAADGTTTALDLPQSNVLAWFLEDGSRVLVRPSGTEPKIKLYFEARAAVGAEEPVSEAIARANATMAELEADLLARTGLGA